MAEAKKWYHSKTVWFNVIFTLAEVSVVLVDLIPVEYTPVLMGVQGVANVVLRVWFTNKAVEPSMK